METISVGPCHNCGSNICRSVWSDPEFIHTLLRRALRLGTDGINFHTWQEILADTFESGDVIDESEHELAS